MTESQAFKELLFSLVKQVKLDMEKQFAKANLHITPFQYGILAVLKHNSLTLNELAHKLGVRSPSLIPPIDALIKHGFVHKQKDHKDRRKIHLAIAANAHKLFDKIKRDHPTDSLNIAFHRLNKHKRNELRKLLSELTTKLPK
jgi:DNA-binding MarR family transcriptional regulator